MKILALHLQHYVDYAQVRGVYLNSVLHHREHLPSGQPVETALISEEGFYHVIGRIHEEIKDELWGIKAGSFITLKLLGLIYRISMQTTTIAEALHYLQTYLAATLPIIKIQTTPKKDWVTVTLSIDNEKNAFNRVVLENTLVIIAREIAMMTENDISIHFGTPFYTAAYPSEWEKASVFSLSFEPSVLKAALRGRDHLHLDVLIPQYLSMIEGLKSGESFANRVKQTMLSMSGPELPDMRSLCQVLCITPRTLQRRLEAENITFREVVEEIKKQISSLLLMHEDYSVSAISFVLGYAEPASFIHSFKKWFGHPPESLRQRLKSH